MPRLRHSLLCCAIAILAATHLHAQADPTPTGEPEVLKTATGIVEVGVLGRAEYRIDIPANWNHSLVVFFHGLAERPFRYRLDGSIGTQVDPIFKRGYAVVQSGYSEVGWAIRAGYSDSDDLRRYFIKKYGPPIETYAAGGSLGGALTMVTLELNPKNAYAGGLDLCGAVGPSYVHINRRFALRAAFDYYFPNVMPPLDATPANFIESDVLRQRALTAMRANPAGAAAMRELTQLHTDGEVASTMGYFTFVIGDLQQKSGANPFENRNWIYTTSDVRNDFTLNDGVKRYAADEKARAYLMAHYWPTGRLTKPMLALHTIYDPLIPATTLTLYASEVAHAGFGRNLVQQYVHREGHCTFAPEEVGHAFDELVRWVHTGTAPQPGLLR